jgi:hypothetical protein
MTSADFEAWLSDEVLHDRMTPEQKADLLDQKAVFESNRATIEEQHRNEIVGYAARQMFVGSTVHEVLDKAKAAFTGRMVYFEPIGFHLLAE